MGLIKLGVFGSQKTELLLYLSRIYKNLEMKCLVVDASFDQVLKYSIPIDFDLKEIDYRGVSFFIDRNEIEIISKDNYSEFDIVLIDFGFNYLLTNEMLKCDELFLISDFNKSNIYRTKKVIDELLKEDKDTKIIRIFKDYIYGEIKKKYIDYILFNNNGNIIKEKYELPMSDKEVKQKYYSQYKDVIKINDLSKEVISLFIDILLETTSRNEKEINKAFKLVRKER